MATHEFRIDRSVTIHAPASVVFPYLADFARWREWSPWEHLDPGMERTISEPSAGAGATYAWSGNRKAGAGRMVMLAAEEPRHVTVALTLLAPFKTDNRIDFGLTQVGDRTTVHWTMRGPKPLISRMFGLIFNFDRAIGRDFERGLAELRRLGEASPAARRGMRVAH